MNVEQREEPAAKPIASSSGHYVRLSRWDRILHAIIIGTFLGLALTGLPLRFSRETWAIAFTGAFGGFPAVLAFHKLCAVVLTAAFLTHLGDIAWRILVRRQKGVLRGPDSMMPRWKDFADLYRHLKWFFWLGDRPTFDRFTYWEKFDYWAVFWGMAIIGISGYVMWFAPFFAKLIPGFWLNVALVIHGEEALLAVWFIFAIHFFNTHLRPGSFPMDFVWFTGTESEEELRERHPAQYERLLKQGRLSPNGTAPSRGAKTLALVIGWAIILAGFGLFWLTLVSFLTSR